jgi:hypothetical protein
MKLQHSAVLAFLGFTLTLLGSPASAGAQGGAPNATLYEVTEVMKVKSRPGQGGFRQATAALMGTMTAGTSLCPEALTTPLGLASCGVAAYATDRISLATGKGPVRGKFAIVVQGDNPTDGPEAVIARGDIVGTIDLSPAILGVDGQPASGDEAPVGFLVGTWVGKGERNGPLRGLKVGGTVTGTFRLPFVHPLFGPTPLYFYLDRNPEPVGLNEFSLGIATVKLELTLTESAILPAHRDDD